MNFGYKEPSSDLGNIRQEKLQNTSYFKLSDQDDASFPIDSMITFDLLGQLFQKSKYNELISVLKSMRIFCSRSQFSQFPLHFDFILFLANCISNLSTPEMVKIEMLRLLEILFIQSLFIDYFNASPSNEFLLSQLSSLLLQHISIDLDVLILMNFINLSGGTIKERDLALNSLSIDVLFGILKNNEVNQKIKYYAARLIHNYCRHQIDLNIGIQIIIKCSEVWHMNILSNAKIELNWAIKNLRPSLKIDWARTIKRYQIIPLFLEGCVYDNQDLAISAFYNIFQLIDDDEKVDVDIKYINGLLSDMNNSNNLSFGCWCIQHLIRSDDLKAKIAKNSKEYDIFTKIFNIFQGAQFECQVDAMFALCALAKSNLSEFYDVFFENNFLSHFLDFFSSPINYDLKIKMVSALIFIFDKAEKKGLSNEVTQEFLDNGGYDLFEGFINDENDDNGKLANKAAIFLYQKLNLGIDEY